MSGPPDPPLTRILQRAAAGDSAAAEELVPLVYEQLKGFASAQLAREAPGRTLAATALVHEAWLKLGGHYLPGFESRAHFFAAAARAMRNLLVDHARAKASLKRGGDLERKELSPSVAVEVDSRFEILALDEALSRLEQMHERPARVVMMRYFAGLELEEIASSLGVSTRTVDREWRFARSWLRKELGEEKSEA